VCGTRIARLHEGTLCYHCEEVRTRTEVDREIAEAEASRMYDHSIDALIAEAPEMVCPMNHALHDWRRLVSRFEESGLPAVCVVSQARVGGAREGIAKACRSLESRCYPVVREGKAYLLKGGKRGGVVSKAGEALLVR
jgi:hypothetical protein